ncbi:citrate lyase subunit alpha [Salmonella enterica subsp. enterica]|uniref:Citrate lyase subunit alpha n=1 Tax=Salmonella enterica I TaxID=59201 RepID=A0A379X0Z7_SALET|nr:citrate lyase subunit alpha [Salmonella enterica subsp. enterica]
MKETVTMLNQQYVVPEGLQPYQGVTANSPCLPVKRKSVGVKFVTRLKRLSVVPGLKMA